MSAHTPGPWHVATYGCSPDYFAIKQGPCTLATKITTEQDARLIAAAPELLAALSELVDYDEGSSEEGSYGSEVMERCRAAIAKAKGTA